MADPMTDFERLALLVEARARACDLDASRLNAEWGTVSGAAAQTARSSVAGLRGSAEDYRTIAGMIRELAALRSLTALPGEPVAWVVTKHDGTPMSAFMARGAAERFAQDLPVVPLYRERRPEGAPR